MSAHFPLTYHLGMNSGSQEAPTYPGDIIRTFFHGEKGEPHEKLRSRIEVLDTGMVSGRDDIGIITVKLIGGEKYVTDAGMRAMEEAEFRGVHNVYEADGNRFLRVLTLEQILAVPTSRAFE